MQTSRRTGLVSLGIAVIEYYRNTLSQIMLHSCRFTPTCSRYAMDALERYGILRGGWHAGRRLLRCHPLCRGGFDPVR